MIIDTEYIDALLSLSEIRDYKNGPRRYFPIPCTMEGNNHLYLAFYVLYGYLPESDIEVNWACFEMSLDTYVEEIDGKVWVRTVYKTDHPNPEKGHKIKIN